MKNVGLWSAHLVVIALINDELLHEVIQPIRITPIS
jgi:hypothetical protein